MAARITFHNPALSSSLMTDKLVNIEWHTVEEDSLWQQLKTSANGLSDSEADQRLKVYGSNALPEHKRLLLWQVILHQFKSSIIYVLLVAAVVSLLVGEYSDAGFIFLVLLLNASLGATQEWKAESSAAALRKLMTVKARVKRGNKIKELDASALVPGDIVYLESGNKVPADLRLLQANQLTTEEALLTGESLPVSKINKKLLMAHLPIGDMVNMAFAGTTVLSGRGSGVVVATGTNTEVGKIASSLSELKPAKPPLVQRMELFAKRISLVVLGACLALGVIGFLEGIPLMELFFFVIAIAVASIPEGLPVAMTVALSIGTSRMAKRNVIVRKLTAVEGLGSCTYIATDKTGTLTVDEQTARLVVLRSGKVFSVTGEGYAGLGEVQYEQGIPVKHNEFPELEQLIEQVVLCNEATLEPGPEEWFYRGDAIDVALLALSYKIGMLPEQIRNGVGIILETPFEPQRKYAAIQYKKQERGYLAVKGALESILKYDLVNDNAWLAAKANELASQGYRIIAVGLAADGVVQEHDALPPLNLLGIVALIDPIRPEAKAAIEDCHRAGVNVAMVTGDNPQTALSIAKELNIAKSIDEVITGMDLGEPQGETGKEFLARVKGKRVFARVSPSQKQQIVQALQGLGHFVAVTGDGVNDAPALKTANIGVAMGYGTDVAKETASIIITDNNFASIAAGIEEGRFAYSNIRKIVYLLISTGAAELIMVALALLVATPLPFLPVQLLWMNLVTNGIQDIGLGFEKGEKGLMKLPPRSPSERMFNPLMIQEVVLSGAIISLLAFGAWYYLLYGLHWREADARNSVLLLMVLLENFHVLNCRSETRSIFRIPFADNPILIIGVLVSQGIHILAMQIPLTQKLLQLEPVSVTEWLIWLSAASLILIAMEIYKQVRRQFSANLT